MTQGSAVLKSFQVIIILLELQATDEVAFNLHKLRKQLCIFYDAEDDWIQHLMALGFSNKLHPIKMIVLKILYDVQLANI